MRRQSEPEWGLMCVRHMSEDERTAQHLYRKNLRTKTKKKPKEDLALLGLAELSFAQSSTPGVLSCVALRCVALRCVALR
jgi:hypothetical protein